MTEKIQIKGYDVWITIDPHIMHQPADNAQEYFTASYHSVDPAGNGGGTLFTENDKTPVIFNSPVEALEYANEKLLGLL